MSIKSIFMGSIIGGLYLFGQEAVAVGLLGIGIVNVLELLQNQKKI